MSRDWEASKAGQRQVIGAVQNGLAVGALVFELLPDTALIHSVAVAEGFRHRWIGRDLLRFLIERAPALDCYSVTVSVEEKLNGFAQLKSVLEDLGFKGEEGSEIISCPLSAVMHSPYIQNVAEPKNAVIPLKSAPPFMLKSLNTFFVSQEILPSPLSWQYFDGEISCCGLAGSEIVSCLCASRASSGICIEWMYLKKGSSQSMIEVIAASLKAAEAACGAEAVFSAVLLNEGSRSLAEKLLRESADTVTRTRSYRFILER